MSNVSRIAAAPHAAARPWALPVGGPGLGGYAPAGAPRMVTAPGGFPGDADVAVVRTAPRGGLSV
jgi:hypothetical protein